MDEIRIGQALEKRMEREEQGQVKKALRKGEDRKETRNILIIAGILVGMLLFSIAGFKVYNQLTGVGIINLDELHQKNLEGDLDPEEGYLYNGYSFIFVDGMWWTEMKEGKVLLKIPLHFGPREVEEVKMEGSLSGDFNKGTVVFMVIDPEFSNKYYSLALSELNFNIVEGIRKKPVAACSKENEICTDREILNCENTKGKPVIELRWGGEPKITSKGTCVLISGEEYGLVKAADRLIWQWYGVMN